MKFAFLFLFISQLCIAQQRFDFKIECEGVLREFIVAFPSGSAPLKGYPLVFMFHGTGGQGDRFYAISQWKELGEREKFISVFPSALSYCLIEDSMRTQTTKWNCGEIPEIACPNENVKNDVLFFQKMLDKINTDFNIDTCQIFVSGFSNGACFAAKLSLELSEKITAVAYSGAGLNQKDSLIASRSVPTWFVMGDEDPLATEGRGIEKFPFNDSILAYYNRNISRNLACLRLKNVYTKDSMPNALHYNYNSSLSGHGEFHFSLIKGLAHAYPNGSNYPAVIAEHFWEFFKTKCITVKTESPEYQKIMLYPNPFYDYFYIQAPIDSYISIHDVHGKLIIARKLNQAWTEFQISGLKAGLYSLNGITPTADRFNYMLTKF